MPIFVPYRLLNFLKTCAPIATPKESSYPYSRHGNTIYTNNFENFVQNIWLCKKFFVPLQRTKRTRVNLCSFRFVSIKQDYGMATRERRLCLVLIKDETGRRSCNYFCNNYNAPCNFFKLLVFLLGKKMYRLGHS